MKEEFRNLGIGKKLLQYFEDIHSEKFSKLFLVDPKAKQLYQNIGYKEVVAIPDLYKREVTEYIMMKEL